MTWQVPILARGHTGAVKVQVYSDTCLHALVECFKNKSIHVPFKIKKIFFDLTQSMLISLFLITEFQLCWVYDFLISALPNYFTFSVAP